jgi:hypothetical protein
MTPTGTFGGERYVQLRRAFWKSLPLSYRCY